MSDQPETFAAIIADMRHRADNHRQGGWESVGEELDDIADRIDAVVERERDEADERIRNAWTEGYCADPDKDPTGNAAAMREALVAFVDSIQWLCYGDERGTFKKQFAPLLSEARAALAAPARNADKFQTAEEAIQTYAAKCDGDDHPDFGMFGYWLFAPAQGGAKCVNGLRGEPDCRGCEEHCEDVRKRNCFYWNPDIEGGLCALTGKKSCPISCDNFHIPEKVSPPPAEGGKE